MIMVELTVVFNFCKSADLPAGKYVSAVDFAPEFGDLIIYKENRYTVVNRLYYAENHTLVVFCAAELPS